ncbi:MAG: hypothetical protein JO304_11400 [Solirubrobacterales bacterium]|nr:hypothetical protein [Solirubrobacterales bacterium]
MSSRSSRRAALAALIAGLAALGAGCGSQSPTTTTGPSAQSDSQNVASAAYAYARCMRSHGVPNFPDPHVTTSPGHAAVGFAVNPSETGSPKFNSAQKACQGILPGPSDSRAHELAHKQSLLAFARCLRANGVHDFPDPDVQGQLHLQTVIAAGVDIHSRAFLDAAKACVGVTHGLITMAQIQAGINGSH